MTHHCGSTNMAVPTGNHHVLTVKGLSSDDPMCIVPFEAHNPSSPGSPTSSSVYIVSVELRAEMPLYGHVGLMFNVEDENNYEYFYLVMSM